MSINDAYTIAELAKASALAPSIVTEEESGRKFLVVPAGLKTVEISDPYGLVKSMPAHPVASVNIHSAESFSKFASGFSSLHSVIFGDFNLSTFTFIGDYHAGSRDADAGRCAFWASYSLRRSAQWETWTQAGKGGLVGQLEFMRFIEENQEDIAAPGQADLLEMLKDFSAVRTMSVSKSLRPQFGVERFEFRDETKTGAVELPTRIRISVPVYDYTDPVGVDLFLRWKIADNDKLMLGLKMKNQLLVEHSVFDVVADKIKHGVGAIDYYGGSPGEDFAQVNHVGS